MATRTRDILLAALVCSALAATAQTGGLIGGVGLTHLTVYEQRPAPDGLNSGSPHVHAVTDEAYYVISGAGRVDLHDLTHGMRTVELKPGDYLQFPPCTLHRIISTGKLTILAVMGNAGLAEAGDARIYFGKAVDDDPAEYSRLAGLARQKGLDGALERRDAAVRAYQDLLALRKADRPAYLAELKRFIDLHLRSAAGLRDRFSDAVAHGPLEWGELSETRLSGLPSGDPSPDALFQGGKCDTAYGMCGILRPITNLKTLP